MGRGVDRGEVTPTLPPPKGRPPTLGDRRG